MEDFFKFLWPLFKIRLILRKSIDIANCQDETQVKPHLFFSIFFFVTCGGCRADLEIGGRRAETTLIILNISTSNFVANNLPDFWGQAIYSQLESRQRVTSYKERDKKIPLEYRNDEFCQQFDWEDCLRYIVYCLK